ncbi:hypothetical protein [Bacillus norwichensis]|uniref:Uncharacterized protein n=1 Tax=Bacillus norwichensis TaxID=2762217 RepID=A0ABR8VRC9_9BACI|nr:hypothetical protein [Bacillus norwichensis]MBD8007302.1 hypothetical protein [Bacillus norwichensis]
MFITIPMVPFGTIFLVIYILFGLIRNRTRNWMQRIILYTFIFYLLYIFDLTTGGIIIPPSNEARIQIQPIPFYFVADWVRLYKINGADCFFLEFREAHLLQFHHASTLGHLYLPVVSYS